MSNTYYTSLSGMMAASYGLQNTSNNVANMQSPGFKRSDVFYSSLGNPTHHDGLGSGVYVGGQITNYNAGKLLTTNNPTDLAISGNGLFIVKMKNGELRYTRDGEFVFNQEGLLTDRHSGGLVQGYDKHGNLADISRFGEKTYPGKASHFVDLKGEFIIAKREDDPRTPPDPDPTKSLYEPNQFDVIIYDDAGKMHTVKLVFEAKHSPGGFNETLTWELVKATCDDTAFAFDPQSIEFNGDRDGTAQGGKNTIHLKVFGAQDLTLNFGDYTDDVESGVRLNQKDSALHLNTRIDIKKQDGYGLGKQLDFSFDDAGQIAYHYDNGQSDKGIFVALALFDDPEHTLIQAQDNLFRAQTDHGRHIGQANKKNFGSIKAQNLESSNVDSTTEFANIVVLQRLFQACSQIMDIDKQLIEEFYKK